MVVRRKPKTQPTSVDDFIHDAGSNAQNHEAEDEQIKSLKLRIPADLLEQIDNCVQTRRPSPSRHQWILEAIYQKLDNEKGNEKG